MRKDCVRLFNIFVVLFACAVCTPYNNGKKTITNNNNNDIYFMWCTASTKKTCKRIYTCTTQIYLM